MSPIIFSINLKSCYSCIRSRKTTVIDLIASADRFQPLYPVGRLDRDTTGLLLITSNGQLGYEMLLPEKVSKTYQVVVNERVTPADVTAFENGIVFADGYQCKPADLKYSKQTSTKVRFY